MSGEITLSTLGQFHDQGYRFDLWCPRCQRGKTVTAEKFVSKLGSDHPIQVADHVRCSECGGKGIEARIRPPTPDVNQRLPGQ